jgi:predicted transcriptional regulator
MRDDASTLSRRERQIMNAVYQLGQATVAEVIAKLPDPPSYSAVRALMSILEQKGHLRHQQQGARYVYLPTVAVAKARKGALTSLLNTFFDGSTKEAIAALLELPEGRLSKEELDDLSELIAKSRKEGR